MLDGNRYCGGNRVEYGRQDVVRMERFALCVFVCVCVSTCTCIVVREVSLRRWHLGIDSEEVRE